MTVSVPSLTGGSCGRNSFEAIGPAKRPTETTCPIEPLFDGAKRRWRGFFMVPAVFFAVELAVLLTPGSVFAEPNVLHYDIDLAIEPETLELDAHTAVTLSAEEGGGPLSEVTLDFAGFTIDGVTWNGVQAQMTRDPADCFTVLLPSPLAEGQQGTLTVWYSGLPDPYVTDLGTFGLMQESGILYAINVTNGAHYWFPCRDRLDDKASVSLALTLPAGYRTAGPGHLESVVSLEGGLERHQWVMTQEVTPYLLSFAASNRYVRQHYTMDLATGPLDADVLLTAGEWPDAWGDLEPLPHMMDWLESRYGRFPYDQMGFHEIPYPGAVEQPGNIAMGSFYWTGQGLLSQYFAHELSHTWFQGLVTIRTWDDVFLSESIATWHELLWTEEEKGLDTADFLAYTYLEAYLIGTASEGLFPLSDPNEVFGYTVYMKGAVVWRLLEHLLGRDALIALLGEYLADPDGVSDLNDFYALLDATGNPDVAMFRKEWIDRAGLPDYRFGWTTGPSADKYGVALRLTQQPGPLYKTPIDVWLEFADGTTQTVTVRPQSDDHTELVCVKEPPVDVQLDPRRMVPRQVDGDAVTVSSSVDYACEEEPVGCRMIAGKNAPMGAYALLAGLFLAPLWLRRRYRA